MFTFIKRLFFRSSDVLHVDSLMFKRLSGACFGDLSRVERLINFEISRASGLSREIAVQRAYDRLMDDRSR